MKSIVTLDNYYSPEELEAEIASFVQYYNNNEYHESLDTVTSSDPYQSRPDEIRSRKRTMKQ
jgi:flagellar basal body rod protein FlgC